MVKQETLRHHVDLCDGLTMAGAALFSCRERTGVFHRNSRAVPWPHQLTVCMLQATPWLSNYPMALGLEMKCFPLSRQLPVLAFIWSHPVPSSDLGPGCLYLCTWEKFTAILHKLLVLWTRRLIWLLSAEWDSGHLTTAELNYTCHLLQRQWSERDSLEAQFIQQTLEWDERAPNGPVFLH